jgi:arylsulfatase
VIHWPKGIKATGEVRSQYHHCNDIVPTILDCCGVPMPDVVDGAEQVPLPGVSMRYSFDSADAPTRKEIQYYEMLGTRGFWHKGWKAVAEHTDPAGPRPLRSGQLAAVSYRRGSCRGARSRRAAAGQAQGAR